LARLVKAVSFKKQLVQTVFSLLLSGSNACGADSPDVTAGCVSAALFLLSVVLFPALPAPTRCAVVFTRKVVIEASEVRRKHGI